MASVISDHSSSTFSDSKNEDSQAYTVTTPKKNIPTPPPLPESIFLSRKYREKSSECDGIPKETSTVWDRLSKDGHGADVYIITEDQLAVPAHLSVLNSASPVLGNCLKDSRLTNGSRYLKIRGVPHGAVCTFMRFLYSSCDEEDMKKYALPLLVLSHSYVIPHLKRVCMQYLENSWLTTENVIDVLQLATLCDAPRLSFVCIRFVVKHFKAVASTDGWTVMRRVNPTLEQELIEYVVEADSCTSRQDRAKLTRALKLISLVQHPNNSMRQMKGEKARVKQEKKVYSELHKALEALIHICKDGCSMIGPRGKKLKRNKTSCGFSGCKGIEMLVRHFFSCKVKVSGGCGHCKRMWRLLELHSCICEEPESCSVPLCRHFKEKMLKQTKKDEAKWKQLVVKVMETQRALRFTAQYRNPS